ncbi:hypothetical protein ACI77I_12330 [Pseudomonas sp. D47]|uniref:hypothetical protein n=1 Tax=Pseudomonas sp. D47 TaxID=3159447 RepID=UPI00387ABC07
MSFYIYAKARDLNLSSAGAMSDYFSGLFFLREEYAGVTLRRISLFLGIPFIYVYKYLVDDSGTECFPLIVSVWAAVLYFRITSRHYKNNNIGSIDFFYVFLVNRGEGVQGVFLWLVRVIYILSIAYAFWVGR